MSDRRHPDKLYMPIAISVRDLVEQVALTLPPDTPKPTEEWVRLQFQPPNPYTNAALRYTGRFNLKHGVQRRVLRKQHEDSSFVACVEPTIRRLFQVIQAAFMCFVSPTRRATSQDRRTLHVDPPEFRVALRRGISERRVFQSLRSCPK